MEGIGFGITSSQLETWARGGMLGVKLALDAHVGPASQHRVEDLFRAIIRQLETGDLDRLDRLMRQEPSPDVLPQGHDAAIAAMRCFEPMTEPPSQPASKSSGVAEHPFTLGAPGGKSDMDIAVEGLSDEERERVVGRPAEGGVGCVSHADGLACYDAILEEAIRRIRAAGGDPASCHLVDLSDDLLTDEDRRAIREMPEYIALTRVIFSDGGPF